MTPQEFVTWLSGFMAGVSANRDLTNEEKIILDRIRDISKPKTQPYTPTPGDWIGKDINPINPDKVPYAEICSCNPKNGGIGICGCIMGNKMVPNPIKYCTGVTTTTTTTYPITTKNDKQILKG